MNIAHLEYIRLAHQRIDNIDKVWVENTEAGRKCVVETLHGEVFMLSAFGCGRLSPGWKHRADFEEYSWSEYKMDPRDNERTPQRPAADATSPYRVSYRLTPSWRDMLTQLAEGT